MEEDELQPIIDWVTGILQVQATLVLYMAASGIADRRDLITMFEGHVDETDNAMKRNAPQIMVDVLNEEQPSFVRREAGPDWLVGVIDGGKTQTSPLHAFGSKGHRDD